MAVTTTAAIVAGSAALSAGTGIAGAISQGKQARKYQEQIQNYERQKLVNPFAGLQVSTLGADRQREDLNRTMTTYGNLASLSGTRGIASLLPNLTQTQNDQTAKIAANLDEQEKQRQQLIAQGDAQVQAMQENREQNDLLGLGTAYQASKANQAQSMGMIAQGLGTLGYAAANGVFDKKKKDDDTVTDPMLSNKGIYRQNGVGNIVDETSQFAILPNPILNPYAYDPLQAIRGFRINSLTPQIR